MAWIKHNRIRINLNQIFEYYKKDDTEIVLNILKNGKIEEYATLSFGDEGKRNDAIKQLDNTTSPEHITGVNLKASTHKLGGF